MQAELNKLEDEKVQKQKELERVNAEEQFATQYADSIVDEAKKNVDLQEILNTETLKNVAEFMKFYKQQLFRVDAKKFKLEGEIEGNSFTLKIIQFRNQ